MFEHAVRNEALAAEPDKQSFTSVALRLVGAIAAFSLVGGASVYVWILLGKAMAWAAVAVFGPLVALELFGLPALRRRVRSSPALRSLVDALTKVALYTLLLQATFFTTLAIVAVSEISGGGTSATTPAEYAYDFLSTGTLIFVFITFFPAAGMGAIEHIYYEGDTWVFAHKLLGWFLALLAVAILFPGMWYLYHGLESLASRLGPSKAGLVLLAGMTVSSVLISWAFFASMTPKVSSLDFHGPTGMVAIRNNKETKILSLDGRVLAKFEQGGSVLRFSPDGRALALDDDTNTLWVREVPSGKVLARIKDAKNKFETLAFSQDGRHLAGLDEDGWLQVWNLPDGHLAWERDIAQTAPHPRWLAFDPSGALLMVGTNQGKLLSCETTSGHPLGEPRDLAKEHSLSEFTQVILSPSGHSLILSDNQLARAFRIQGTELVRGVQGGLDGSIPVLSSCDDQAQVLAVGWENDCRVHFQSKSTFKLELGSEKVQTLALDGSGRRLVTASKKHLRVWDLETRKQKKLI